MKKVSITTDYIKLGQFLKFSGLIGNGAEAKDFLIEIPVLVNDQDENRRGRKLVENDVIEISKVKYIIVRGNVLH